MTPDTCMQCGHEVTEDACAFEWDGLGAKCYEALRAIEGDKRDA